MIYHFRPKRHFSRFLHFKNTDSVFIVSNKAKWWWNVLGKREVDLRKINYLQLMNKLSIAFLHRNRIF